MKACEANLILETPSWYDVRYGISLFSAYFWSFISKKKGSSSMDSSMVFSCWFLTSPMFPSWEYLHRFKINSILKGYGDSTTRHLFYFREFRNSNGLFHKDTMMKFSTWFERYRKWLVEQSWEGNICLIPRISWGIWCTLGPWWWSMASHYPRCQKSLRVDKAH